MIKIILKDGTSISDKIRTINTMSTTMKETKTDNITIIFESIILDEELAKFTTENCEKVTIVDTEGDERVYEGFNTSISVARNISAKDTFCNVTLTK